MPRRADIRSFTGALLLASVAVLLLLRHELSLLYVLRHPVTFALLAQGVLVGELLPVRIPRRGEEEQITISTTFSFALLLIGGLGPAVVVQSVCSAIQDLLARKAWWRVAFNITQYVLALAAATLVMRLLSLHAGAHPGRPFDAVNLPVVLLAGLTFCACNALIVGAAVALHQRVSVRTYLSSDPGFIAATAGVLLCLVPIVSAAAAYLSTLLPLFTLPMLALHRAANTASKSRHAALHDPLTGLPNRSAFRQLVDEAIRTDAGAGCMLLLDLNRFKEVNDTLGHIYGDRLLEQVARRLREFLAEDVIVAGWAGTSLPSSAASRTGLRQRRSGGA